jgi:hypothetical protein
MVTGKGLFSAPRWVALLLVLEQLGCSPEYSLLETEKLGGGSGSGGLSGDGAAGSGTGGVSDSMGGTGAGGLTSGGGAGGTGFGGVQSVGGSGGTNSGGANSAGTSSGGIEAGGGVGNAGGFGGSSAGSGGSCTAHEQCGVERWCSGQTCMSCPAAPASCDGPCAHGFQPVSVNRNGCTVCECAPPSECTTNADCQNDEICYAGQHCRDGCAEPSCCFGNQCAAAGCGAPPGSCLEFGCRGGTECLAACDATSCECNGGTWSCASVTGGAPVASCPQACSVP